MTVDQFIADLDELVGAVCKRVGKTKVESAIGYTHCARVGLVFAGVPRMRRALGRLR